MNARRHSSGDSSRFLLPAGGWQRMRARPGRSTVLLLLGVLAATAALVAALRYIASFQRLDFEAAAAAGGCLVIGVEPRSGASRAGLAWGDLITAVDATPVTSVRELQRAVYSQRVAVLTLERAGQVLDVAYYPPPARVDVRYLLVSFAAMFTLVVAVLVYLSNPVEHAGRFLALAEALLVAVAIPLPHRPDVGWQALLLVRDLGRLALPPLLVTFFATFPSHALAWPWQVVAFLPSLAVGLARVGLAAGVLPPVVGNVLLPEALDGVTVLLVIVGVVAAALLGAGSYVRSRDDPTRRRQVEWVALGAAAGFIPYLVLSLIPQLAGAELEVLTWISLLPLALVPLGVASSLLEFRLWDLEEISRQVVATGAAVLLGGVSFALLNYAITSFGFELGNWRNLVAVAGGILLVTLALPARRTLLALLERLQYRERLAARRALTTFAEEAAGHRDPRALFARLSTLLQQALAVDRVVTYIARSGNLYPSPASPGLPVLSPGQIHGSFPTDPEQPLKDAGLWHRFPLERDDRVVGLLYCGRRPGGIPLGHGERRLVSALAAQAALALENALLLEDLRRQVEEHRLLEGYLERIFESSAAALIVCDAHGAVLRANQRASSLLGLTGAGGIAGRTLADLMDLPAEWRSEIPAAASGVPVQLVSSGTVRDGLISTSVLEVEPGRFDGRVVAIEDISEQLRLEQRLAQQERLAALGRLAAGLAHEINTPVTGIASYAQLLHDLTPAGDPRSPLLGKLEEQAFRVARIVSNLLTLARPSGIERQSVDLSAVAREEAAQIRSEAEGHGVRVVCEAGDGVIAEGNRVQLELLMHNVLRNAVQATPPGGEVLVRVGSSGDEVYFEVADTGPGVPAGLGNTIFEPFVTTKEGRGGTGLGLAISQDIVRAHGGSMHASLRQPQGTVVRVQLPSTGGGR